MKAKRLTTAALLTALSLPVFSGAEAQVNNTPPAQEQTQPGQPGVAYDEAAEAQRKMVEAAFLGVNAEPLDFDTAKLLGVQRGTGLLISYVAQDSPASVAGLKKGDVITKLDDQLLINPEQLAVLIRTHQAGDNVALHVTRDGEAKNHNVKLVTREVPDLGPGGRNLALQWRIQKNDPFGAAGLVLPEDAARQVQQLIDAQQGGDLPAEFTEMVEQMNERINQQMQIFEQHRIDRAKMMQEMREQLDLDIDDLKDQLDTNHGQATASGSAMVSDGEHEIKLTSNDDDRHLTVKDKNGKVLYDGPMPANGKVPGLDKDIQAKVDKLFVNTSIDVDQIMKKMREQVGLDIDDLKDQLDTKPGQATASGSAMVSDGEHEIKLASKDGERHLTIKDKDGNVIFDGPMPDNGKVPGLDKDIQAKVDKMLVNTQRNP